MICAGCKRERNVRKLPYFCNCGTRTNKDGSCVITPAPARIAGYPSVALVSDVPLQKPSDLPKQVEQWLDQFSAKENKNE